MGREKLRKQRSGRLIESLKMERVRTILTHRYPYPHEHSRHLMIAVFAIWLFFVSSDNLQTLIMKLDKNFKWWSMYIAWIFLAALYHLPSFQSMGLDLRMNLSLFLSIYISSLIFLIVFHVIFLGLWYLGLVSRMAEKKPEMLTIIQNCALASNGSGYSNDISPVYSLWATFIGLYIANYVVERSTGWALTHPLTMSEYEKLKKQLKPDFEDMVPWYSGTSTDLFKTVFDLMVSVTLFVGRFDMRMMQAAMNKTPDESKSSDLFYDHLDGKDELWFDFIADTGDGGNSTYAVARLLAQPSLVIKSDGSRQTFPRGQLLLIGGDLAYPNPSSFSYERRFFCPFEYALQPPAWYKSEHIALEKPELPLGVSELRKYRGPQCFMIPGNHDWFDGLHTFMRYICHKSWLGGWFLPQKRSYFALKLPNGWWVFGLDQALHGDIDVYQFKFFAELCQQKIALGNILKFRRKNWQFDVIGGFVRRALLGFLHAAAHLTSAVLLMLLMELAIEICNRNNLLATSGYHTLYEWYRKVESEHFPDPTGLRTRLEQWTFGLYPACIKYLMSAFDIPEVMAVTRSAICRKGIESLPRGGAIIYYVCVFLYFWVLSTPVVSLVFGSYLYICINWFHIHFDEAFSSLRIANYKAFTRFHIKKNGDLEVFTLAVDKVPKEWMLDPDWDMEPKEPFQMSYTRKFPSKWRAASGSDPTNAVRVVDHFVIPRTPPDSPTSGSAS
uniref:Uncharacterized protein n=1 Tax=Oryza punctata TaxID=4537 RepID=A0A0E0LGR4_ORYPU